MRGLTRRVSRVLEMARTYRNWPTALADRAGLIEPGRQVTYDLRTRWGACRFVAITGTDDVRVINEVWLTRVYDPAFESVTDVGTGAVVDVGANRGYFAVYAAARLGQRSIYCFEPEPTNAELLERNLQLNEVASYAVERAALVADDRSKVHLYLGATAGRHSTIPHAGPSIEVPALNFSSELSTVLEREGSISLLKLDTEGTEVDLLGSLPPSVVERVGSVVAEVGDVGHAGAAALVRHLQRMGFTSDVRPPFLYASQWTHAET